MEFNFFYSGAKNWLAMSINWELRRSLEPEYDELFYSTCLEF